MEQNHVLRKLAEGFEVPGIGNDFFSSLCKSLIKILDADYFCIGKLTNGGRSVETIAYCSSKEPLPNVELELADSPCEQVMTAKTFCHFSSNVGKLFPASKLIKELSIESYFGIPIYDSAGSVIGIMVALHTMPTSDTEYAQSLFRVVAKRVQLEMERLINEDKIRRNEAQLKEAQQIANVGSFEWEVETDRLTWSDQLYRIYGYHPGEVEVNFNLYLKHVHPDYKSAVWSEIQNVITNLVPFDHEYTIIDKQENQKVLHSIGKLVAENGKVKKLIGVCHDITTKKKAENELKRLNAELEDRVKKRTETLEKSLAREKLIREISLLTIERIDNEQVIQHIAEKTGLFLNVDGVQIFSIDKEVEFKLRGNYSNCQNDGYDKIFHCICSDLNIKSLSEKNVNILLDSLSDLSDETRRNLPPDIQSLAVFEFFQNTRPYGIMLLFHCSPRKWADDELQFLDEMLNQLGSAVFKVDILRRKRHAMEESLAARNKLKLITDGAPAFISYVDKNLNYQYVNSFYKEFFGLAEKDIVGKNVEDLLNKQTYATSYHHYQEALSGKKIQFENVAYDKEGRLHELDVQFIPEIQSGEVNGLIILATVITDRKNIERELKEIQQKLEQKNKMLEMLQHVSQVISGELEHDKVVQTITDAATALTGAEFGAFINNTEEEIREAYHFVTLSGISFSGFQKFPIPSDARIFAPTFKGEGIIRYKDVSVDITPPIHHPFIKSYIAVPVYSKNNKVIGGLFFGHSEPGKFTEESEKILEGIAPQAAIALDNARLFNESRLAKKHAEEQRNLLYDIFNRAPSLISVCKGKNFIYEFVNKEFDKFFPGIDLLGQSLRDRLMERGHEEFVGLLDRVFNTGETYNGKEVPVKTSDTGKEQTLYFDFIVQALRDEKDEIDGLITYATDISDQVYARKTIEEFMSVASHELKTPLTTVMAYSELLEDEIKITGGTPKADYISKMNTNLSKLNNLISDLLDVSRIQSGKMLFKNDQIDFDAFIKESLENMKYTTKSHKIVLSGSTGAFIGGDREKLDQAIANLVSNAIKYSPKATEISVKLKREDKRVSVSIKDYGMGIPKEKMKHLFQRFYRIEEKGTSGLGIGLYITKEIIDRHGGEITVASTPGKGTVFNVFLPIEP